MHIFKIIVIAIVPIISGTASAKCFSQKDQAPTCRYEKGDPWCAKNDKVHPYAFDDKCLQKKTAHTTTADVSGLKTLRQEMTYKEARKIIIDAGWQTFDARWQDVPQSGRENLFYYDKGWMEVHGCTGAGIALCRFEFHDIYNNKLVVITGGECEDDNKCTQGVVSWTLEP